MTHTFTKDEQDKIYEMKNIAADVFNNQIIDLLEISYDPVKVDALKQSIVIAGGLFPSTFHREPPKDRDIFILKNHLNVQAWIDDTCSVLENSSNSNYRIDMSTNPHGYSSSALNTNNMLTKIINVYDAWRAAKIQIMFTNYQTREELIDHFDFTHCKANYHNDKFYISRLVYDCIRGKILISNKAPELWRKQKFLDKGYLYKEDITFAKTSILNKLQEYMTKHDLIPQT